MYVCRERKAAALASRPFFFRAVPLPSQHGSAARCGAAQGAITSTEARVKTSMALARFDAGALLGLAGASPGAGGPKGSAGPMVLPPTKLAAHATGAGTTVWSST